MTNEKLLLLDGNSLAYRAFFALPPLTNQHGIHTNAVYGFTMMLDKIIAEEQPTKILVAFDAGKTTFRHTTFTDYKGGRQKTPPELSEQFPYIRKLIDAYGIARYELDMYEADDIIGTLAKEAEAKQLNVVIVSGDKDLTQLVTDSTTVYITRKGMTDLDVYTPAFVAEKYGLTPAQIIDMKGLMGDASDNIPGVPGVGEKTAIKLLTAYGTVEAVYENINSVSGAKLKEKLIANEQQAYMSKQLATIHTAAPITITIDDLAYAGINGEELRAIYQELGFKKLLDKTEFADVEEEPKSDIQYSVVTDVQSLPFEAAVHVELAHDNYHTSDILGMAIASNEGIQYIPVEAMNSDVVRQWLEDDMAIKYVTDRKAAQAALARIDLPLEGVAFDLLLATYIVNPSLSGDDVATLVAEFDYRDVLSNDDVYGKGAKRAIPSQDDVANHASRKAFAVWTLRDAIEARLRENAQYDLYYDLELPLARILGQMETAGITVSKDTLQAMGDELRERLQKIEAAIYEAAGETFNINSPKQLGVILFEKLGLPVIKKTKTGYSTAADVLDKLKGEHAIIEHILLYRQLAKLQSTYIEGLIKEIHDDGKVHTRFQQALTSTGRLSSVEPNLQNIPIRLEEGRKIRQAFVPSHPDWYLFAADYSQIELRVLAHMCQDPALVEAFNTGMDIHTRTAMDVFHVGADEVDANMRRTAKAVNFGIVYGISDYGLSQNLSIPRQEAAEFIERYLKSFPGVQQYMDVVVQQAKVNGYVTTMLNRRRYLPDINHKNFNIRSFAERMAMNMPIQGSAADIIKKAMIDMEVRLRAEGLQSTLLLQVHDELIFEGPKEEMDILARIVPEVMEQAVKLSVPLKVDFSYGKSWYEAK